ncbi:MAG: LytTR family DNA-binding domain-containing protein [Pseudomonadota bacterium]
MIIAIIEDEPLVARRIERLTGALRPGAKLRRFVSITEAREALAAAPADVVLLDLNLRGDDGFGLLAEAVASPAETIVISANVDRAIEAFEWGVVDFVPKPFDQARLGRALDRLEAADRSPAGRLVVRHRGQLELVDVARLIAIHGAGDYAELELDDGSTRLHEKGLEALGRVLPARFLRVHRSHVLNLDAIRSIRSLPGSRYRATLATGAEYPVSRRRVQALRDALAGEG